MASASNIAYVTLGQGRGYARGHARVRRTGIRAIPQIRQDERTRRAYLISVSKLLRPDDYHDCRRCRHGQPAYLDPSSRLLFVYLRCPPNVELI